MAFIALAEIGHHVFGPLVGFSQQQPARVVFVNKSSQAFDEIVRFRQIFAIRAFAFVQVRDRVEPETVNAEIEPEANDV